MSYPGIHQYSEIACPIKMEKCIVLFMSWLLSNDNESKVFMTKML